MDQHGYPDDDELKKIAEWDILKKPVGELIDFVESIWRYADCGYFTRYNPMKQTGKRVLTLKISTGGWSGNESIIAALMSNSLFWLMYWYKSKRGGHYWFRIPEHHLKWENNGQERSDQKNGRDAAGRHDMAKG